MKIERLRLVAMKRLIHAFLLAGLCAGACTAQALGDPETGNSPPATQHWDTPPAPGAIWGRLRPLLGLKAVEVSPALIEKALELRFEPPVSFERTVMGPAQTVHRTRAGKTWYFNVYYIDAAPGARALHFNWAATPAVKLDAGQCTPIAVADEDLLLSGWRKALDDQNEATLMRDYVRDGGKVGFLYQRDGCITSMSLYFDPK